MPVSQQWRAVARVSVIICLGGFIGSGAMARTAPQAEIAAPAPADIVASIPVAPIAPPSGVEPFGLTAVNEGPLAARWRGLQPALRMEARILTLCRANAKICPPAAKRFLAIIDAGLARSGRARFGEINRAVNLAIKPMSDLAQYGAPDVWATPLMTFASGAGDCEDYAIAKYVALRQAGIAAADVRLVVVNDRQTGEDHAVTAARLDGQWLILDNRTMMLRADRDELFMTPLLAFGDEEAQPPTVATAPKPFRGTGLTLASRG
jgi:predicted transglutaminase-like cysteine proteinase